jgi:hypothetical protein
MLVIRPDTGRVDLILLQEVADAPAEGIAAHFRYIGYMMAQPGHPDSIIQFRTADMAGKMFHLCQRTSLIRNEKTHGFTDGKYVAHRISPYNDYIVLRIGSGSTLPTKNK